MITDIFSRRYSNFSLRDQYFEEDRRFMNQMAVMLMDPLWRGQNSDTPSDVSEANLKKVHDIIALEMGREFLSDRWWWSKSTYNGNTIQNSHKNSYATICKNFLIKIPDDVKLNADSFIKERLSLAEVAFQNRWRQVQHANACLESEIAKAEADLRSRPSGGFRLPGSRGDGMRAVNKQMNAAFYELVRDLNERLRLALYKLSFHNGLIQVSDDETANTQIAKPFWELVSSGPWLNVDIQIKEALDRRDNGDRTAAFHAVCALESCIKIISDTKTWTKGNEKGAANYVDNLVSQKNGRFIEPWEAELLKGMFSDVRNPFAHGPGQAPMPNLTSQQTDWAIDIAMSWIKNLIRRL